MVLMMSGPPGWMAQLQSCGWGRGGEGESRVERDCEMGTHAREMQAHEGGGETYADVDAVRGLVLIGAVLEHAVDEVADVVEDLAGDLAREADLEAGLGHLPGHLLDRVGNDVRGARVDGEHGALLRGGLAADDEGAAAVAEEGRRCWVRERGPGEQGAASEERTRVRVTGNGRRSTRVLRTDEVVDLVVQLHVEGAQLRADHEHAVVRVLAGERGGAADAADTAEAAHELNAAQGKGRGQGREA